MVSLAAGGSLPWAQRRRDGKHRCKSASSANRSPACALSTSSSVESSLSSTLEVGCLFAAIVHNRKPCQNVIAFIRIGISRPALYSGLRISQRIGELVDGFQERPDWSR